LLADQNGSSVALSVNTLRNTIRKHEFSKGNRFPKIQSPTANVDYVLPEDLNKIK